MKVLVKIGFGKLKKPYISISIGSTSDRKNIYDKIEFFYELAVAMN